MSSLAVSGLGLGLAFFGLGLGLELCGLVNITGYTTVYAASTT